MSYDQYPDAVQRANTLERLVPKGWRVFVIGNSALGYHLSLGREDEPRTSARLESDEDIKRLLALYVEQLERVSSHQITEGKTT